MMGPGHARGFGSTCLFCHGTLDRNQSLEHLSLGRRIAFDTERGRLWIICWRCTGWNLVPLYRRWEAVEECARQFETARQRYATEHIALARLPDGTELVRIGSPSRPEFAAWRYGDRFGRRRRIAQLRSAAALAGMGALALVGGGAAASGFGITAVAYGYFLVSPWFRGKDAIVARLPLEDGTALPLTRWDLRLLRFGLGHAGSECVLDTQLDHVLQGEAAQVGLSLTLPLLNRWGGKEETRRSAVSLLEEAREPARYVQRLADRSRGETIRALPPSERLALEMAVNEEAEGRALERELRLLELAWKEAEEIAAIADGLLVPPELERKIAEWRSRHGGDARAGGQGSQRSHFA